MASRRLGAQQAQPWFDSLCGAALARLASDEGQKVNLDRLVFSLADSFETLFEETNGRKQLSDQVKAMRRALRVRQDFWQSPYPKKTRFLVAHQVAVEALRELIERQARKRHR